MDFLKIFFALTLILINNFTSAINYKDYKVATFIIENEVQLKQMQVLDGENGFTFLEPPEFVNSKVELVMRPELFTMFEEIASSTGMSFKIATDDLQSWIDAEKPLKQRKEGFSLDKYNILEDIYAFMDEMEENYPEASIFIVGESYEGRTIKGMKITKNENNPGMFIEATIHAREWIATATSVWIINEILTTTDPELRNVIDSITWYIIPVVNVDGYQYTHDVDRLWRKTRSVHNLLCRGVDPNRNFGYNWREGGSSKVPCTTTYSGPAPFSEKETKALMDYYSTVSNKTDAYICFHSAAKMLMYPLGNTLSTELVPNRDDLQAIAEHTAKALESVHGTVYQYGNAMATLYVTSGSSRDHAYGYFHTPLVFTYEMREGQDSSIFILPPEEIQPNSEEIFTSLIAMIEKGKELGYFELKN